MERKVKQVRSAKCGVRKKYARITAYFLALAFLLAFSPIARAAIETDEIPREDFPSALAPPLEIEPGDAAQPEAPGIDSGGATQGDEGEGGSFSLVSPGGVLYDMARGLALAQNDVTFTYREFAVRGDRGVIDYNKNQAILTGNLTVTVRGQVFRGKSLTFDLDSGRWHLTQIETTFPPEFFPPGTVLEPIYVRDGTVTGTDDTAQGNNFKFSSCDRDHYYIQSKRLDFYRDAKGEPDRIVLKSNALYVFGRKILPLPVYVLSLSGARSQRIGLQPIVGQNATDGYFVKTVYDLAASERKTDSLLIDLLQKRGLGLGFQRELANGAGLFYLYALSGQSGGREIDSRVNRRWQITPNLNSILTFQSTKNNSFGGQGVSSQNGDLQFNYIRPKIQSSLFTRYSNSSSEFGSFTNYGSTFQHRQEFGKGLSIDANSLYNGNRNSGVASSSTFDNTLMLNRRARALDTFLNIELHDDLLGITQRNGAYALERIPELGFTTDARRLGVPFLGSALPGDITLSLGSFNEPQTKKTTRADFAYSVRPQTLQLLRAGKIESKLLTQGRFEQAFYGDNTARYNYDYSLGLENKLGPFSSTLNYVRQRNFGFTPFQFDFLTPSEYIDTTFSFQPSDKFRVNLNTGRDLQNKFSRDIDARLQWAPSKSFYASLGTTFSPTTRELGDITGNFRFARSEQKLFGGNLDLGIRYSPTTGQFSQINSSLDLLATRKTRVQALTGYNGFTKRFDFNQIRVTRDLHCFNLYATFDSTRKELRFDLALKAFPFVDTRYGIGQQGQGFETRIGDVR